MISFEKSSSLSFVKMEIMWKGNPTLDFQVRKDENLYCFIYVKTSTININQNHD